MIDTITPFLNPFCLADCTQSVSQSVKHFSVAGDFMVSLH